MGLSVREVTAQAGLAKGTFYVHFTDRAALLVDLHRSFHGAVFAQVLADTAPMEPGPERAQQRMASFLDHSRRQHAVRSMLLEARSEPAVLDEVRRRNDQAAHLLAEDLVEVREHPLATARLLVAATAEVALHEVDAARALPDLRAALAELVSPGGRPPRPTRRRGPGR
jgi:TetR/AcrR family transcriptional regulator, transcriptional repressor for nem operon